jgi:hypothetical protein
MFPEFNEFNDPLWPINAFLLVILKSSSQIDQRARAKLLEATQDPKTAKLKDKAKSKAKAATKAAATATAKGRKARTVLPRAKENLAEVPTGETPTTPAKQGQFVVTL